MTTYLADTAETLTVEAPSATFAYRRFGPKGRVPLVAFMRFRGTLDHWDPAFLDQLSTDNEVIIFDNVGVGSSTGETPGTVGAFADGALEFVDALGLTEIDVLGWSLGGAVAQAVVLKRPDLVRRVVVAGSGPGTVPDVPPTDPRVFEIMAKPVATPDDVNFLFYPETGEARALAAASDARIATRLDVSKATVAEDAAQRQFEALASFFLGGQDGVYDNLAKIEQPVLYANGSHDVMVSSYGSYAAVQRLPHATLVLYSDAGHAFLFQHIDDFVAKVRAFLNG